MPNPLTTDPADAFLPSEKSVLRRRKATGNFLIAGILTGFAAFFCLQQLAEPGPGHELAHLAFVLSAISVLLTIFGYFGLPPLPKKKRNLARETEAVSPVLGVILMVAITVVLASIVFVLVHNLASRTPLSASETSFQTMGSTSSSLTYRLLTLDGVMDWATCILKDQIGSSHAFTINAAPPSGSAQAGDIFSVGSLTSKTSYDFLLACGGSTMANLKGVTV